MADCRLLALPAELRLSIYEYVLSCECPISRPTSRPETDDTPLEERKFGTPIVGHGLLKVNHQLRGEALPVLYDINTIAMRRSDFCLKNTYSPVMHRDLHNVKYLKLTSFERAEDCKIEYPNPSCEPCKHRAFGLLDTIAALPQVKTIDVDYSTYRYFDNFRHTIRRLASHRYTLTCAALGTYQLTGETLEHLTITFKHETLLRLWSDIFGDRDTGKDWRRPLNSTLSPFDPGDLQDALGDLAHCHDRAVGKRLVPANVVSIWPSTSPVDLRNHAAIKEAGLMEVFDEALMTHLLDPLRMHRDWRRWVLVRKG